MRQPPVHIGQIVEVTIDRLALGGAGLSRVEGFVVFTPFTVPGDTALIEIREVKKGYANGVLKKILNPSPQRIEAPCPYFERCGGCDWQNISYQNQLENKVLLVREAIKKFHLAPENILPILASPHPFRYRNRIQLHSFNKQLGFKEARSHHIVDIDDCLIAEQAVAEQIKTLRPPTTDGRFDIRRVKSGQIIVTNTNEVEAELGFSQVNTAQNEHMIRTLVDWTKDFKFDFLLDLYSGNGNLTFPLHNQIQPQSTLAVEMNKKAVADAVQHAYAIKDVEFICESVEHFFIKYKKPFQNALVVLDPPRAGAGQNVMDAIAKLKPRALFYVSCDPVTWARDVQLFLSVSSGAYQLKKVQPLDMFPQTAHIEIISMIVPT